MLRTDSPRRARLGAQQQRMLVFVAPLLVTSPRFWNGFVFDDLYVIVRGTFIHDPSNLASVFVTHAMAASTLESAFGDAPIDTYRPISIASFFWDSFLSGHTPWAYHLTNSLLHALNCVLLLELLRRLCQRAPPVLLLGTTLCFALSPWLAEAHVWINGRSDLFVVLFAISAVMLQRSALAASSHAWALSLGAGVLSLAALLSKETAVLMLPFVVLVPSERGVKLFARAKLALPQLLAFVAYVGLRENALHGLRSNAGPAHAAAALWNLPLLWIDALIHLLLPVPYVLRNLRDDYAPLGTTVRLLALMATVLTLAALAHAWRRRNYTLAWGVGLALSTLAPCVMITTELWQGFGRFLYLPAIGVFVVLCDLLSRADALPASSRALLHNFTLVLAGVSALMLVDTTIGFRDDLTLYRRALAASPEQGWTHGSVGLALKREDNCEQAMPLLAEASRMVPGEARYLNNLARCLITTGRLEQAQAAAREGQARFHDRRDEVAFLLDEFLTLPRATPRAALLMERCLRLIPQHPECVTGMAATRGTRPGDVAQ